MLIFPLRKKLYYQKANPFKEGIKPSQKALYAK